MTRMMLSPCTATMPAARPSALRDHDAGNASIAARSTSVASTPLQPASIETAKLLADERSTLPFDVTLGSNQVTRPAETRASVSVHGSTNQRCAGGVSSSPNSSPRSSRKTTKNRIMESLGAGERRVLREIAPDARGDRFGEAL